MPADPSQPKHSHDGRFVSAATRLSRIKLWMPVIVQIVEIDFLYKEHMKPETGNQTTAARMAWL